MAEALVRYETIDDQQIKDIMAGKEPKPPEDWDDASLTPPGSQPPAESDKKPGLGGVGTPAGQH